MASPREERPNNPSAGPPPVADSRLREQVRSLQLPPLEERRRSPWRWLVLAVVLVGGALAVWRSGLLASAGDSTASQQAAQPADEGAANATPGQTPLPSSRAGIVLESPGYITPAHRILVSPKVSGMLIELNIEEGMRVEKGDVLGVIESVEYGADARRAEATLTVAEQKSLELETGMRQEEIEQARAELKEAQARLVQLDAEFRRSEQLSKIGGVSQSELDDASASRIAQMRRIDRLKLAVKLMEDGARDERREVAKAEVEQAKADLVKARWRLDNCTIRSPISGTILKKNAEEGNIVNPIAFNGSFSVCEMADLADLEVDLSIQERDVSKIFKGQKCKVRANAYQDRVYDGYVDRLMPIADRAKGAIPVRVKVKVPPEEEGVYLKPDMSAIVTFYGKDDTSVTAQK